VRLLLEKDANIKATRSNDGSTAQYNASWRRHAGVVSLLWGNGTNIGATRSDIGSTPLDVAAYNGHSDVVRLLLEKGAETRADHHNKTDD